MHSKLAHIAEEEEEEEEKKRREETERQNRVFPRRVAQASPLANSDSQPHTDTTYYQTSPISIYNSIMSFLFGGAPKMSSAEKIAAAETEVEMISDMFNR